MAGVTVVLLLVGSVAVANAQTAQKLYGFSSGMLVVPKGLLQNGAGTEKITVPVGFYVVKHAKGNVLFDTGNNDKIISDPSYWGPFAGMLSPGARDPGVAIDAQLRKIGLSTDDIKYVVVGHLHLDHGGNVAKFPNSTLVVQKDEIKNAFWPEPGTAGPYIPGDTAPLRSGLGEGQPNKYKIIQLEGDIDLFGDGSVYVKRAVGHTPGSQMLRVRLPKTGTVVLTSDNVYFRENLEKNILPEVVLAYSPPGILAAYQWIRETMAIEGGSFMTAHDPDAFKAMKKAPDSYE
jgi:glyoxylase-like metal-dependent hydrolase (beta-lactamase superfamily II)